MRDTIRNRFAYWVEQFPLLERLVFRPDGVAPNGRRRYVNRINGHVVLRADFR